MSRSQTNQPKPASSTQDNPNQPKPTYTSVLIGGQVQAVFDNSGVLAPILDSEGQEIGTGVFGAKRVGERMIGQVTIELRQHETDETLFYWHIPELGRELLIRPVAPADLNRAEAIHPDSLRSLLQEWINWQESDLIDAAGGGAGASVEDKRARAIWYLTNQEGLNTGVLKACCIYPKIVLEKVDAYDGDVERIGVLWAKEIPHMRLVEFIALAQLGQNELRDYFRRKR